MKITITKPKNVSDAIFLIVFVPFIILAFAIVFIVATICFLPTIFILVLVDIVESLIHFLKRKLRRK